VRRLRKHGSAVGRIRRLRGLGGAAGPNALAATWGGEAGSSGSGGIRRGRRMARDGLSGPVIDSAGFFFFI